MKVNLYVILFALLCGSCKKGTTKKEAPNIIVVYVDDLGYGDVSAYGTSQVETPNVDRLAQEGLLFTNAYATASICTPSRYAFLTGEYHWRNTLSWSVGDIKDVGIAPGDAGLIIDTAQTSLAEVLRRKGYRTGVVGKWHLGLGPNGGPDWNGEITPGPRQIGFDYSFIMPATADRVPCVFVEDGYVYGLDPKDPIQVSYQEPISPDSTIYNPSVQPGTILTYTEENRRKDRKVNMHPSFGHDQTIINGIPRIGYMTGGKAALWQDDKIAETLTEKALNYIERNKNNPFFLYLATHDIHVPRVPGKRFAGKSKAGIYGDVIMQMDWTVGQVMEKLEELGLSENTILIFTSDNGPVLDDGYADGSFEGIGMHKPSGALKEGKYSAYEGGTRVPMIVRWPNKVQAGKSDALFSQIDFLASIAAIIGAENPNDLAPDSRDYSAVLLGAAHKGREHVIQQNMNTTLSIVKNGWKFIEPSEHASFNLYTRPKTDLGNREMPQLYQLSTDRQENINLAQKYPEKLDNLRDLLSSIKAREQPN